MCEKVQGNSNLASLLPGFGWKTQSPLWAAPASRVWARYTQIDLSLLCPSVLTTRINGLKCCAHPSHDLVV
ncbi:hypothetical protein HanPSC8_Chr17g0782541 [Helianthus annuus]|nr:hypothetical protein HanPSC8_Chr17g0782541 [Helianthus annuus]